MRELHAHDFAPFFRAVYGVAPFPWQLRLIDDLDSKGHWPHALALPTGSGKTSTIDIAVFALARELSRPMSAPRRMPTRIVFVVDRRLIVDGAADRAERLSAAIAHGAEDVVVAVRDALASVGQPGFRPLFVSRLRGGMPRERDWTPSPSHPTVLLSTVDQVGSRLLFRGYGISDSMRPVHAGLLGADSLILLDEVHLSEPFRQTLRAVEMLRGDDALPWAAVELSATPRSETKAVFRLTAADRSDPVLRSRLEAQKQTSLLHVSDQGEPLAERYAREAIRQSVLDQGDAHRILVVVNRIDLARNIFIALTKLVRANSSEEIPVRLLIGRAREVDKGRLRAEILQRTESQVDAGCPAPDRPFFLVATQTVEAGADLDFDVLITQIAPLDALRQRFGRIDRVGRLGTSNRRARGLIVASNDEIANGSIDPIYGAALRETWIWLQEQVQPGMALDFGIAAMDDRLSGLEEARAEAMRAPHVDAPTLMPSYLELVRQTRPSPEPDLPIPLFLHGPAGSPPDVLLVWRADIPAPDDAVRSDLSSLFDALPPRVAEAVPLPVWTVRRWLGNRGRPAGPQELEPLADVPQRTEHADVQGVTGVRVAWRWRGVDREVQAVRPSDVRPGDVLVVPASYGGCDAYGWSPMSTDFVVDVAAEAAEAYASSTFAVRIHRALLEAELEVTSGKSSLAELQRAEETWARLIRVANEESNPVELAARVYESGAFTNSGPTMDALRLIASAERGRTGRLRLVVLQPYGLERGESTGFVLFSPSGLGRTTEPDLDSSTEDDERSSLAVGPYTLSAHSEDVERIARQTAERLRLPGALVNDVALAGWFHDLGKADDRFQRYLAGSRWQLADEPLAKSLRPRSGSADRRAKQLADLPERWRHEALSVRIAREHPRFTAASDPQLVLFLIGVHHGWGRPWFPHDDPYDGVPRVIAGIFNDRALGATYAPNAPEFRFEVVATEGLMEESWPALFDSLCRRYGQWKLALLEAVLRLADHRASAARKVAVEVTL